MKEKNPRYNGLWVFKPDLTKLRPGDVILTRNAEASSFKGKRRSDIIAKVTRGKFSHALICTALPTLIEALADGVSNISAQNCFVHDLKHVRVLRYPNQAIARAAASEAFKFFGKEYSVQAALRSVLPGVPISDSGDDRTFCSALVAAVYRAAGAPEFASVHPMKTTPATLEKSAHFADVTSDVFVSILSPSNIEEMSALDGDRAVSPMAGQSKLLNSYYAKLSVPIDEFFAQYPTLTRKKPTSFFECLPFINSACIAANRLPDHPEANEARERVRFIDDLAFEMLSEGKWQAMMRAAQAIDDESMRYSLEESFKADPDVNLADTLGMIKATEAQIASRSSILIDPVGQSRVWDEWVRMTHEAVSELNTRLNVLNEVLERVFPSATRG
ncbi:Permuted papain-like amidase enzyme, YaeF/YiiX, C92 family [Bradyrhizobium sp. Ghvi]|uniref:YiiX/YebB-like N1pC/P60 family cysteine hydrolase n=1 Tax=Bradyrhizobium sp. Ghvi TaxID=1855319 RepID=UPI0008EC6AC4|nr:YiiX/YebB-like N1pC/P60 family cysteine hydrolase [Bradyrhizobium sp. Ghvi]SFQ01814.1 Permuted papain-like amidase enzyme, YaeF/YiiX, C92 family [Bradyrhizobium sp. Ghvi]